MDAGGQMVEMEDTPEANISLAFSAARLHRRRHAAGMDEENPFLGPSALEVSMIL